MLLDEVYKYLIDNSICSTGNLHLADLPSSPDTVNAISEYAGSGPQIVMGGSTRPAWENPRIQVVCRSTNYQTARNKAESIYRALFAVGAQTLKPSSGATGCLYLTIEPLQPPFYMGKDENRRHKVACNYKVMKAVST